MEHKDFPKQMNTPSAQGTVEDVVYRNTQNGYTVIELIDNTTNELVTAVGSMPFVGEGEIVTLWGTWTAHPEFGKQLSVTHYEKALPEDTSDILRYLSSKSIKGVGPSTALKIVNRFGRDTFEVIEKHPEWLTDIPGISPKKAAAIGKSFLEQARLRTLMTLCAGYIPGTTITRIYEHWGDRSVSNIQNNPYRLCHEIYGVGFDRADELAQTLGIPRDSELRVSAAIRYVLEHAASVGGHTCLSREDVIKGAKEKLELDTQTVLQGLARGLEEGNFVNRTYGGGDWIYLKEYDKKEADVAKKLHQIHSGAVTFSRENLMKMIERMENEWNIRYATMQREAIGRALSGGVMILTGGPGTGKTTVIRALLRIFDLLDMAPILVAPTGRAAKRMSEATVHEAKTVHRALEMTHRLSTDTTVFLRNEENPLDSMAVIVDESSMIDLTLMDALLAAMKRGSHLILVGDADQLPSVGCGNVLSDMINSGSFPVVALSEIFRQSQGSHIVTNAHRINMGQMPILTEKTGDFFFLPRKDDFQTVSTLLQLVKDRLPKAYGEEIIHKLQIITPTRKGRGGTEALNLALQACLNPPSPQKGEMKYQETVYRLGDRVMQIRNNYDLEWVRGSGHGYGVFNGDTGTIVSIDKEDSSFTVAFDDRTVTYEMNMLDEIEHAYAITVHKSQGSEYSVVMMPLCQGAPMLQTRNLLYTALTRAKDMVILVGREEIIENMVDNNRQIPRYTCLKERLQIEG